MINYHLNGTQPGTEYFVSMVGPGCNNPSLVFLGDLTTNGNGVANAVFTTTVGPGAGGLWLYGFNSLATTVESAAFTP